MTDRSIPQASGAEGAKAQLTSEQRFAFLAEATYVTEHLLDSLLEMAKNGDADNLPWMVLGVVPRLQQINFLCMTATNECTSDQLEDGGIQAPQETDHE